MDSSQYQPPVRRSLTDEELDARVNLATSTHTGIEALMELLVAQEALRAQEQAEIEAWEAKMEADGSPEALAALAKHRGQAFQPRTDQVPTIELAQEAAPVIEKPIVEPEPEPVSEPFSWFTKPEPPVYEETIQVPQVEEITVIEEIAVELEPEIEISSEPEEANTGLEVDSPVPVGHETSDEFEELLSRAAAEEELTALEESMPAKSPTTKTENLINPAEAERNRKPISQFVTWIGATAVLVPGLLVWVMIQMGLGATTILIDISVGYLVAGLIIAMASLAGKRSGLSTATISRAIFGVWGNSIPMTLVAVSRIVLTGIAIGVLLTLTNGFDARVPTFDTNLFSFADFKVTAGFITGSLFVVIATILNLFRQRITNIIFTFMSIVAVVLMLESFVGFDFPSYGFRTVADQAGLISKTSLAAVGLTVFVATLAFAAVAPNLAKTIPMRTRGIRTFLSAFSAHFLLPVAVAVPMISWLGYYSRLLAEPSIGESFAALPWWVRGAFGNAILLSVIFIITLSLRTSASDLHSLLRTKREHVATGIAAVLTMSFLMLYSYQPAGQAVEYLTNLTALIGVFSSGWIGMLVADVSLRRIAYHELSLTRSYGYYGKFNTLSLALWLLTVVVGILIVPVNLYGLEFMGSMASVVHLDGSIGSQAIGFCILLTLGMLLTLVARIPQIRKQEKEVLSVESRREQLNDIFIGQE